MVWPILTFLALLLLLVAHLSWRRKLSDVQRVSAREISRLQQLQEQTAAEAKSQQELLFDSMAEGLVVLDRADRIQMANRSFVRLFGLNTDVRSRTIMEALRLHEVADLVQSLSLQQQVIEHELRLLRPNELWLQVNGAAIFDSQGNRQGAVLVFHNLTRLKQLERTRQEFVANVSHELRTPLSLIKGYAETLLSGAKDNPEVATKFLAIIERNADRLKLLIEDLLSISELESGRVSLNLQPIPLRSVVDKVTADFRSRAAARSVTIIDRIPELNVMADADRLEQVLGNLLDNAIKYGRVEGTVTLNARALEDGQVEVAVQDDGPGIPADAIERVFERFFRADKARSREQGGTGLGLSIVKHIVQAHGGRVWAQSQPGKGATFFFTLPRVPSLSPEPESPR
jgi:two-component system, OmpR family, phosphate regulon sensor histidine kinase PhoR